MSGLADLLAGRAPAGVHLWPSAAGADEIGRTVTAAGWRFAHLVGDDVADRDTFLVAVGEALDFPDTYGANFDALADLLDDVGAGAGKGNGGTVLLWDGWDRFAERDERWFEVARAILGERAGAKDRPPFVVLLRENA